MPEMDTADIHVVGKLFAGLVFKMLLEENMISEELVENMRSWKHSGFNVYRGKPIKACDADSSMTLSEYISRAPFSLERMSFNEGSDTVLYRGEHFHPTLARNFDVSDPLEWIARITSHIPHKGAKQVIYYRAYSQAWRGREHRQGILQKAPNEEKPISSMKDRPACFRRRRQLWAVLLKKIWDVNALKCPKCGGEMKVISFIEQPFVIRRILKHLDLWEDPRPQPEPLEMVCEPNVDYSSGRIILEPSSLFEEGLPESLTGMGLEIENDKLLVSKVIQGSPAEEAGILEGDILLEIDGNPVTAEQLNELSDLLPDTAGAAVSLKLVRDGSEIELELITDYLVPIQLEGN